MKSCFIFVYYLTVCNTLLVIVVLITVVKISIAPVELFIQIRIVYVAFCPVETTTPLVIAYAMSLAVDFSPKLDLVATTIYVLISIIFIGVF